MRTCERYDDDGDTEVYMLCPECGATNPDISPFCGKCGLLLGVRSGSSAAPSPPGKFSPGDSWDVLQLQFEQSPSAFQSPSGASEKPAFTPVAHIPFNQEPLPQPSQPLPALVEATGEVLTFSPAPAPSSSSTPAISPASDRNIADYPTDVSVPVPVTPSVSPDFPSNPFTQNPFAQDSYGEMPGAPPASSEPGQFAWGQQEEKGAFPQATPGGTAMPSAQLGNVYPGSALNGWEQDESYAPSFQAAPSSSASPASPPFSAKFPGSQPLVSNNIAPAAIDLPSIEINKYVQPLPLWVLVASLLGGALLLTGLTFLNPDWATGAIIAAAVAILLAVLVLIAGGVRVALGLFAETNPRRLSQTVSTSLLVVLLFAFSAVGFTQQNSLHAMQARFLESHQNWPTAISEYKAAGETSPASGNLARVYNEWGEALSDQQQYADSVEKFSTVLRIYPKAAGQIARAKSGMVAAYFAWGKYDSQHQDYVDATAHYDALLALTYCDATCQTQGQTEDATAYYQLAGQQLNVQQYATAVNAFNALVTRFSKSPEAGKVHQDYAKALWGLGQQQLTSTCSDAVKTYQQLAKSFADTDQGKKASTALKQPVTVKGHFTTAIPGDPFMPSVALVQGLYVGIQQFQFPALLTNAPTAPINSDGTFTITKVQPGTYELVWSSDGKLHYFFAYSGDQVLYTAKVGPLCTYDYGDINETIRTDAQ